jgi:predicted phage baseplate assembly protein
MFVPLPNLDDRRWTDLVDEARSLIPVYAPAWTDYNESDPGITIMEMLAWIAESDIYRANRVPDAHTLAFLALIGVAPWPPAPAFAPVQFTLKSAAAPLLLPATTELDATMLDGKPGKLRLRNQLSVLPATIAAIQIQSAGKFRDTTGDWMHGKPIAIFGSNPQPGDSLYLGFDGTFAAGDILNLYLGFQGDSASGAARRKILEDLQSREQACVPWQTCGAQTVPATPAALPVLPPHHSATTVWEVQTQPGVWQPLIANDDTRSATLSGPVSLTIAPPPAVLRTGAVAQPLRYIRCRLASGSLDAAPVALRIMENTGEADQTSPLWEQWSIAPGVVAIGAPALPGQPSWLRFTFNAGGSVASLEFSSSAVEAIRLVVLAYKPATAAQPGSITVEAMRVAAGTGAPNQLYSLTGPELSAHALEVYTIESGGAKAWSAVGSFVASGPADLHYVTDAGAAEILFGDGQNGRVPPASSVVVAAARITNGAAGNAAANAVNALDAGPHNAALFDVAAASAKLQSVGNPDAAAGGADPETIEHAEGRAALLVDKPERAVTLGDCEELALETPGTVLARAAAIANYCPGMQCYSAPGFITLVIVPFLPVGRPVPSAGLMSAVSAYLNRRRVIGTRIEVTGPEYLEVAVNASVKAATGQNKTTVGAAVTAALQSFLDPLGGGPDGTGWPLGRGVYISEILETIAKVPGVDHVVSLQLTAAGCGAQCGDICLDPLALAVSGSHGIQVS